MSPIAGTQIYVHIFQRVGTTNIRTLPKDKAPYTYTYVDDNTVVTVVDNNIYTSESGVEYKQITHGLTSGFIRAAYLQSVE